MIIKGSSRAGPSQLSRHLQRTDTNARVEVLQLDSPTGNLGEALRDWQLLATGTRGSKGLYHANIDPDARYTMTPEQWLRAADVLEKELGLTGQPRAVVMHEKHGRTHIHVVWQRTDIDAMTLVPDSHNYRAHERASMALELEFGHERVPGKHDKRDREKQPELPKAEFNHAEWQQAEREGRDPRAMKAEITALYEQSDTGSALRAALEQNGYVLAQGDRRDYVIVDGQGQVHSLARQIKGVTAKDLRGFMADLDRETIPSVDAAKAMQRERGPVPHAEPVPEPPAAVSADDVAKIEAALKERHENESRRQRELQQAIHEQTARILDLEIAEKVKDLLARQQAARARFERMHHVETTGFDGFVSAAKAFLNPQQAALEKQQRDEARAEFHRVQEMERRNQIAALTFIKERELEDLNERHAQQQREQAGRQEQDLTRYIMEHEAALRLLTEIEARRREEERRAEQQRSRDGPPLDRAR